jgi:hypothetical protein
MVRERIWIVLSCAVTSERVFGRLGGCVSAVIERLSIVEGFVTISRPMVAGGLTLASSWALWMSLLPRRLAAGLLH